MKKIFPAPSSVCRTVPQVNRTVSSVNRSRLFLTAALFALLFALSLTSCATVKKLPGLERIYVTNTKQVNLLPNDYLSLTLDDLIQLHVVYGDTDLSVLLYVQADKESLYIEVMNDFMITMGTLFYDGSSIEFDCAAFPPSLKPEYILYDLQNVFWTTQSLQQNFAASKISFEEEKSDALIKRTIKDGSKLIEEIIISLEDGVVIKNYLRNYEYTLFPVE